MPFRPNDDSRDYERFYDEIGSAQLEERYLAIHGYAVGAGPAARRGRVGRRYRGFRSSEWRSTITNS
jgi:hypothetical protein